MTLEGFCQDLAPRPLTNAQRAVAILWWHRQQDASAEMSAQDLAGILHQHALAHPKPSVLLRQIKNLNVTLPGSAGGLRLRADKLGKVKGWLGESATPPTVEEAAPAEPLPTATPPSMKPKTARQTTTKTATKKPALFIGSSVEGLKAGRAIHEDLEYDCEPTVWNKGVFGPNKAALHSLLEVADRVDFAVVVLTPDDVIKSRGKKAFVARDNCIFELGLFMGVLGPGRCFYVYGRDQEIGLPSDLAGLVTLTYPERGDGNLEAALQTACNKIRKAIQKLGVRVRP